MENMRLDHQRSTTPSRRNLLSSGWHSNLLCILHLPATGKSSNASYHPFDSSRRDDYTRPVLRSFILYLSGSPQVRSFVSRFPLARRVSRRFVAGETLEEAIAVVRDLNARGLRATVDFLGENVYTPAEAQSAVGDYQRILQAIDRAGVTANVSLKLTHLGLDLGESLCVDNLHRILETAQSLDNFVRIDMEGSDYTDRTLAVFRALRRQHGFDNVGVVIQAYLHRSERDIAEAINEGARVRLCKGAYQEPPDRAFQLKPEVDANFVKLARCLLDGAARAGAVPNDGNFPPLVALATHDHRMIQAARTYASETNLPPGQMEFQMLYGIRRELQSALVAQGFPVRVYVPFGTRWYPYLMRRLAERPANLWFFLTALFRG